MQKVVAVLGFVMAVSCGGGGGGGFKPGVAGNKPLNTVTPAEAKTLCTNALTFLKAQLQSGSYAETVCRASGVAFAALNTDPNVTDAQIKAACEAGYALCKATPRDGGALDPDGGTPAENCANVTTPPATCMATVGEYSACVNETVVTAKDLYPPCNQLTKAKLAMLADPNTGNPSGPACTAFEAKCPGMMVSPLTGEMKAMGR